MLRRMSFERFQEVARPGTIVPVYREVVADTITPVGAFGALSREGGAGFLLESAAGGEQIGRYSFIGTRPEAELRYRQGQITLEEGSDAPRSLEMPFSEALRSFVWGRGEGVEIPDLPRFVGGAVGYLSYDYIRDLERLPGAPPDDRPVDIARFLRFDRLVAFDHLTGRAVLIQNVVVPEGEANLRALFEQAEGTLADLRGQLGEPFPEPEPLQPLASEPERDIPDQAFQEAVERAKEHIVAGDIFQVVLSRRLSLATRVHPFTLYRAIRTINPSPYLFYLATGEETIIGASPELMVRVERDEVEVRPIAGTRRRGATAAEDEALAEELRADPKERAEHLMLLDLGRNDVGRVAAPGSVGVEEYMVIERFSHVMHLVSDVKGRLREGCDALDALEAAFPAGTVSGAPKIRAMEIIDRLEHSRRGWYAGTLAYLDYRGNLDSCILIRSLCHHGDRVDVRAGAGIVHDSTAAGELRECEHKARAMLEAVKLAEQGLRAR